MSGLSGVDQVCVLEADENAECQNTSIQLVLLDQHVPTILPHKSLGQPDKIVGPCEILVLLTIGNIMWRFFKKIT